MRTKYETNVVSKFLPLYGLSKFVPVPMKSCYTVSTTGDNYQPECATWWQWRGRVWNHKVFNDKVGW
jgi:hypothetical protein